MIAPNPKTLPPALTIGGKRISLSNLDKRLYPSGFTKGQAIDYYLRVAPVILPHLRNRAVTLKRYPNGSRAPFFFEKNCPLHRPDWVKTARIPSTRTENKQINHCLIGDRATLLWVANLAALELHVPLARADRPGRPTVMVFDLDPGAPASLIDCASLGIRLRDLLSRLGLQSFPKTSGSKGLHVYVPLNGPAAGLTFDDTKTFALAIASLLARDDPQKVTMNMSKSGRAGRVFVDWSQNDTHKTTVCPYSLRAAGDQPGVSTPIAWDQVEHVIERRDASGLTFSPAEVIERVAEMGDLFATVLTMRQRLPRL